MKRLKGCGNLIYGSCIVQNKLAWRDQLDGQHFCIWSVSCLFLGVFDKSGLCVVHHSLKGQTESLSQWEVALCQAMELSVEM
jgi:hypothetical protein